MKLSGENCGKTELTELKIAMKKIDDALDEATKQISAVYRSFYPYRDSEPITLKKELYHLLLGLDKTNGAVVDAVVEWGWARALISDYLEGLK